jgi:hypothetical protein
MDLLTFNADGTVDVALVSKNVKLRRPTVGEFKKLRLDLEAKEDEAGDLAIELTRLVDKGTKIGGDERLGDEAVALSHEIRNLTRVVRDRGESIRIEFLVEILTLLDSKQAPVSEEDFPTEVVGNWIPTLVDHWRARPTVPGDN